MMKKYLIIILASFPIAASANFQTDLLRAKRGRNGGVDAQWTLADWLSQKNKASLMNQWLALHSSSDWFEMNVSGASQQFKFKSDNGTTSSSTNQTGQTYTTDINFSIFNLNGEYQKTNDDKESYGGAAGLRLLGGSAQSTSLTARYGWRRLSDLKTQERWENQYAEGVLQLYIVQEFGVNGTYRYYFPATSNQGSRLEGHKVTAGVFFEFFIFRVSADYFQEPLQLSKDGVITRQSSEGFQGGVKLFF
jgi:hypothetical protein